MNAVQPALLEHILERIPVGVVILDCTSLRILYSNTYLQSLLPSPWHTQSLIGHSLREIVPHEEYKIVEPLIQEVCLTGRGITFSDLPYEGFLETRGRTYWHISIEFSSHLMPGMPNKVRVSTETQDTEPTLLVTIEDVTMQVGSRQHLDAIHYISSAILGQFALPQVFGSILQAVQELVGSTRCAILLIDNSF